MNMKLLVHVKNTIPRAHLVYITEKGIDKLVLKRLKYSIDLRWKGHGERTGDIERNERRQKKLLRTRPFPEQVFEELVLIITISRAEMNQEIKDRQNIRKQQRNPFFTWC